MSKKFAVSTLKTFLLIFPFLFSAQSVCGQNNPEITALEPNVPIEREIAGGQKHEFQISFAANQYGKIVVSQKSIDVVARLIDESGAPQIVFNAEPRKNYNETIELFSETGGNLRLTIEPNQKNASVGRYEIRLVERREANSKDAALDEANKLISKANALWIQSKYSDALPLAERGLALRERALGAEHADVGMAVFVVGNIVGDMGDLEKCEMLYDRALKIREKALGRDHPSIASILNNWGVIYKLKGDYVKAEELYKRVLEIREKTLEPNHLLIAVSLNNLASVTSARGDREKTIALYRRALTIRENALGAEHPDVALALNNLATALEDEDFAAAEPLYLRSLAIREKILGADHPDVSQTLYNLARGYAAAGDYQKAEQACLRAIKIYEKSLGSEHQFYSYPLNLLALIYKDTGRYDQAETLFLRAIALKQKTQSSVHPELGGTYSNLANLYALEGKTEKAVEAQSRANEILEYNTALNLAIGSEREKLDYLKTLEDVGNQTLTLNFQAKINSQAMTDLAAISVLRRKGRVLDAMSDNFQALRRRFDKQDQILFDDLNKATTELVHFVLANETKDSTDEYSRKLKTLEEKRETVENQISRRSAGFYQSSKSIKLSTVGAVIPADAALIEFAVYRPILPSSSEFESKRNREENAVEKPRYAVFVINSKGEVRGADLGAAADIDPKIDALRKTLRDAASRNVKKIARAVDEKILKPVRALVGDAKHLLISPDGDLNLIPFEALVGENDRYLIEDYSLTYITSGRDLLRMQAARKNENKSLIVANPLFGSAARDSKRDEKTRRRSVTTARSLSETYFAPLAGTLAEARSIQNLFPDATLLDEGRATEAALKNINAPRILHIATHGFFLENTSELKTEAKSQNRTAGVETENPLLRSGIALAGANEREGGAKDDGILTALEASGLNLWGTKLVVLSACDTGIGDVKNGEGVYGLRRAFLLAGTESLVMSLWAVSDYATRELMTDYYKNLKNGLGRGESLRQVKLAMMKKKGRAHPFYWAGFIQSGEWANLEGKR